MQDLVPTTARVEVLRQLKALNDAAKAGSRDYFSPSYDERHRREAWMKRFEDLDKLLRSIYTDSAVAWLYIEAAKDLMFANRGEVHLKPMIDKVSNYQKGTK